MRNRLLILAGLTLLFTFVFATTAYAATTKYTFNDVTIGDAIVEIAASVKDNNQAAFSVCNYFSDDYGEWLGQYGQAIVAGETAEDVLAFCIEKFDNRTQ